MWRKMRHGFAPSTRAASASSEGHRQEELAHQEDAEGPAQPRADPQRLVGAHPVAAVRERVWQRPVQHEVGHQDHLERDDEGRHHEREQQSPAPERQHRERERRERAGDQRADRGQGRDLERVEEEVAERDTRQRVPHPPRSSRCAARSGTASSRRRPTSARVLSDGGDHPDEGHHHDQAAHDEHRVEPDPAQHPARVAAATEGRRCGPGDRRGGHGPRLTGSAPSASGTRK